MLTEIRCPKLVEKKRHGEAKEERCNNLLVRVAEGSSGEAYCDKCREHVQFNIAGKTDSIYDILKTIEKPSQA